MCCTIACTCSRVRSTTMTGAMIWSVRTRSKRSSTRRALRARASASTELVAQEAHHPGVVTAVVVLTAEPAPAETFVLKSNGFGDSARSLVTYDGRPVDARE